MREKKGEHCCFLALSDTGLPAMETSDKRSKDLEEADLEDALDKLVSELNDDESSFYESLAMHHLSHEQH
jgi:hypothetical protein